MEASALTLILERLFEVAPSGSFSATDVIAVLDEVEELIDGLAEAGKDVAQKANECDCTVSLTC